MKKNGFTLIEIIGAIIILSIISIIVFSTYTSNLKGFRDDYYTEAERTIEQSSKEFFNDNRNFRPNMVLGATKVSLSTLEEKDYLDDVVDYSGSKCSTTSYGIVIKEGKDEYTYHSCLICPDDSYDGTVDNEYCDEAWLDTTNITYEIDPAPTLYVYKGTPRSEIREALRLNVNYTKRSKDGKLLKMVGTGTDDAPTVLPKNIDTVNPDVVGTYEVEYEFIPVSVKTNEEQEKQKVTGKVIVYENDPPAISYDKENLVAKDLFGGFTTVIGTYTSGEWVQKLTITIDYNKIITEPGVGVRTFQWNKDGRWRDFCDGFKCVSDPEFTDAKRKELGLSKDSVRYIITEEMNETVQFRMIATNGKISQLTEPITIRIDNTKPTCTLKSSGTYGQNNWYISDVGIEFAAKQDMMPNNGRAVAISGERISNITISTGTFSNTLRVAKQTHNVDTTNVTYIGFIEDEARNHTTCSISFKRDTVNPICRLATSGTYGKNSWYISDVGIAFSEHTDVTSGVAQYGLGTVNSSAVLYGTHTRTHNTDTKNVSYMGFIIDDAGHTSDCSISFKRDTVKPTCTIASSGTYGDNSWYITDVGIKFTATGDETSGVYDYGIGTAGSTTSTYASKTRTHNVDTTTTTYTGFIEDYAGHTNTCSTTFKRDTTKPNCAFELSGTMGDNSWYTSNVGVSFKTHSDATSGVRDYGFNSFNSGTKSQTQTADTASVTYTGKIKDNAGLENTCTINFKKDATKPTCSLTSSGTKGDNSWYTSAVTVSFSATNDNLSGIATYGVGDYTASKTTTHSGDTTSKTYTGYIKDKAGNTNSCSTTFKKDGTAPSCTISVISGTAGSNGWYTSNVTMRITASDATSDVSYYGFNGYTNSKERSHSDESGGTTYTGAVKDNAGNSAGCNITIKKDAVKPTCTNSGDSSSWTGSNRTIYYGCSDSNSGCDSSYNGGSKEFSSTTKTSTISAYTIKDNAGNTTSCSSRTADVYVDKTKPSCTYSARSGVGGTGGITITVGCDDNDSGCTSTGTGTKSNLTSSQTYTIYDNVGNSETCSVSVSSQTQTNTRSCNKGKRCSSASCETYKRCSKEGCNTYSAWSKDGYSSTNGVTTCKSSSGTYKKSDCSKGTIASNGTFECSCINYSRTCTQYNRGPKCECETRERSISKCGCDEWKSWSGWKNTTSCSASSSNSSETLCQTLYY